MASSSVYKGRFALIILAVLFLGPLILAYASYYSGWRPGGQVQKGHIVDPVQSLPQMTVYDSQGQALEDDYLHGPQWTMLYVGSSRCAEDCERTLYNMRQVWKSLHRKSTRVQGVYVALDRSDQARLETFVEAEHRGMQLVYANPGAERGLSAQWKDFFTGPAEPGANIYLIDPLGNWMLYYRPGDSAKGLLKDIKKLLHLSNIG